MADVDKRDATRLIMDTNGTSQHISHQFDKEMEALRDKVLKMGGLVEQQISGAIDAL